MLVEEACMAEKKILVKILSSIDQKYGDGNLEVPPFSRVHIQITKMTQACRTQSGAR